MLGRIAVVVAVLLGLFLLLVPYGARVQLGIQEVLVNHQTVAEYLPQALQPLEIRSTMGLGEEWLEIPAIQLAVPVVRGDSLEVLNHRRGVWLQSAGDARNIVLAGHRFRYARHNAGTLANVGRLRVGDIMNVRKDGSTLRYRINNVLEVGVDETWYLASQPKDMVTLYTCTLTNEGMRLVIQAELAPA